MKRLAGILVLGLIGLGIVHGQNSPGAKQVLDNCVKKISAAKGIETKFTVGEAGKSEGGSIYTSGTKFHVSLPRVEVWYNGKELYTYNRHTNETTLVNPTREELAESNPLQYVAGATNNYNVSFSTVKKVGSYVLELVPVAKRSDIKRITLTVGRNDFLPQKMVIEPRGGSPTTVEIKDFKFVNAMQNSVFEYPKNKYSKVEVIDLR